MNVKDVCVCLLVLTASTCQEIQNLLVSANLSQDAMTEAMTEDGREEQ